MQLVEFSNLLEEGTSVGPQSAVVGHGVARKIEAIYILKELRKEGGGRREKGEVGRERRRRKEKGGGGGRREREEGEKGRGGGKGGKKGGKSFEI